MKITHRLPSLMATLLLIPVCSLAADLAFSADPARVAISRAAIAHPTEICANTDETQVVSIVAIPLLPEGNSDTHVSPAGIGALYWAARHPSQAWRVVLPVMPNDARSGSHMASRRRCGFHP